MPVRGRPIIFSGSMVRAIPEGRKTQTRRVVKPQPKLTKARGRQIIGDEFHLWPEGIIRRRSVMVKDMALRCPYGKPGDLLWVREAWRPDHSEADVHFAATFPKGSTRHLDQDAWFQEDYRKCTDIRRNRWRPSIHMPKWACRLWLKVKAVWVERLQEITPEDAEAEGVHEYMKEHSLGGYWTTSFARFWNSLNAKRGHGWETNPWVWVIEFDQTTYSANERGKEVASGTDKHPD